MLFFVLCVGSCVYGLQEVPEEKKEGKKSVWTLESQEGFVSIPTEVLGKMLGFVPEEERHKFRQIAKEVQKA